MSLFENPRFHYLLLFTIAILVYGNTLQHEFVLDDDVVIVRNAYVQQGIRGIPSIFAHDSFAGFERVGEGESLLEGGRYRPLSLAFFAILISLFGRDPFTFHLFAVFVFALAMVTLYAMLLLMFKNATNRKWLALFTVLLFAVHPVHTEVVANVKSADEILAFLFGAGALFTLFKSVDTRVKYWLLFSGVLLLLACLAKESAVMLMFVAPLALWFFRQIPVSKIILYILPMATGVLIFLLIRQAALGQEPEGMVMHDPLNNPFLVWSGQSWIECSPDVKAATIIYTLGQYMRLMVFPHPLIHGYYPFHFQLQSLTHPGVLLSLILLVGMTLYGVWSIKHRANAGFGILFFLITISLTSNIPVQIGSFMAERFLFLPGLGLLLAAVMAGFRWAGERHKKIVFLGFGLLAILFSIMTVMRNQDWKSNEILFRADVRHSPASAKFRNELGTLLLDKALITTDSLQRKILLEEALPHLGKAVELHPTYYDAYLAYGACAYYLSQYRTSVGAYRTSLQLFPGDNKSSTGLYYALQAYGHDQWLKGDALSALTALEEVWGIQPDTVTALQLATYHDQLGQMDEAVAWLEKALAMSPADPKLMYKLAMAYQRSGRRSEGYEWYKKAKQLDHTLPETMKH